jgi:hypothetical protein
MVHLMSCGLTSNSMFGSFTTIGEVEKTFRGGGPSWQMYLSLAWRCILGGRVERCCTAPPHLTRMMEGLAQSVQKASKINFAEIFSQRLDREESNDGRRIPLFLDSRQAVPTLTRAICRPRGLLVRTAPGSNPLQHGCGCCRETRRFGKRGFVSLLLRRYWLNRSSRL